MNTTLNLLIAHKRKLEKSIFKINQQISAISRHCTYQHAKAKLTELKSEKECLCNELCCVKKKIRDLSLSKNMARKRIAR